MDRSDCGEVGVCSKVNCRFTERHVILGENQAITPEVVRKIIEESFCPVCSNHTFFLGTLLKCLLSRKWQELFLGLFQEIRLDGNRLLR